jgi:hypothetical protein
LICVFLRMFRHRGLKPNGSTFLLRKRFHSL